MIFLCDIWLVLGEKKVVFNERSWFSLYDESSFDAVQKNISFGFSRFLFGQQNEKKWSIHLAQQFSGLILLLVPNSVIIQHW